MKKRILCLLMCYVVLMGAVVQVYASDTNNDTEELPEKVDIYELVDPSQIPEATDTNEKLSLYMIDTNTNPSISARAANKAAERYGQNKTLWCWVTASGGAGQHYRSVLGGNNLLSTNTQVPLNYTDGVHGTWIGYLNGRYAAHGAQVGLVRNIYGNDANKAAGDNEKMRAMNMASGFNSSTYGYYLDNSLLNSLGWFNQNYFDRNIWVVANMYNGRAGHSVIISDHIISNNTYYYFDPYSGAGSYRSQNEVFVTGIPSILGKCPVKWVNYPN